MRLTIEDGYVPRCPRCMDQWLVVRCRPVEWRLGSRRCCAGPAFESIDVQREHERDVRLPVTSLFRQLSDQPAQDRRIVSIPLAILRPNISSRN